MRNKKAAPADRPVCVWVPVTDATGRTRMEARWTTAASLARSAAA
jgi:hypothetical protein